MRKYLLIAKASIIEKLQYTGNLLGRFITYAIIVFMFTHLWRYLYNNGGDIIEGYSLAQMIWYVIMTELVWFSTRTYFIRREISNDIKSGKIAYTLNKPYNYVFYVLSKYFGEAVTAYIFNVTLALILGFTLGGELSKFSLAYIPFIVITFILATFITAFVYLMISLVAFWFEENAPFFWIYDKFALIVGTFFPVEIFPPWAQAIIKISPIYTSMYAPAKMAVDFSYEKWLEITIVQLIYFVLTISAVLFIYGKGVKKLNVNGG